jgi:uncharacterized membrane protein YcaP (DUF421 family)
MFASTIFAASLFVELGAILRDVFGGDVPEQPLALYQVAARAVAVYVIGVFVVRFGKSRMLSRTTPLDVLIGFILGSLLSRGVTGHASMSGTIIASVAVVAAHWAFTWLAWRSHWLGNLIKGHSRLIVRDGKPLTDAMRNSHISDHDLMEHLRLGGVDDVAKVREAYKERNGEISVIRHENPPRVIDVAVESGVQTVRIVLG